jgi:hypothetical protein
MGFTSDRGETLEDRQGSADEAICASKGPSREVVVVSGLCSDSGHAFRGGNPSAPKAWVHCETTEACLARSHQRCKN